MKKSTRETALLIVSVIFFGCLLGLILQAVYSLGMLIYYQGVCSTTILGAVMFVSLLLVGALTKK